MKQISIAVFLFLAVSLFGEEYFASNSSGMLLEKISRYRTGEFDRYIKLEREDNRILRTLYGRNGELINTREIFYGSDGEMLKEVVTEGNARTETVYDGSGILEESFYRDGILTGREVFIYDGGILEEILSFDGEGNRRGSTALSRDSSGRITGAVFSDSTGEGSEDTRYVFSGGRLIMEWHGNAGYTGTSVRYDLDGRVAGCTEWLDGKEITTETFVYGEKGLESTVLVNHGLNTRLVSRFDSEGRTESEEEHEGDRLLKKRLFGYDESSNLISSVESFPGGTEKILYTYEGDRVKTEKRHRNGTLYKIITYRTDNDFVEDIMSGGGIIATYYYLNRERVKKEEWENAASDG